MTEKTATTESERGSEAAKGGADSGRALTPRGTVAAARIAAAKARNNTLNAVEFIEPGHGRPDYLYLQNIDRALIVGDLACFFIAGLVSSYFMIGETQPASTYVPAVALATFLFSRMLEGNHVYKTAAHNVQFSLLRRLAQALVLTFAMVTAAAFGFAIEQTASRGWLALWLAGTAGGLLAFRLVVAGLVRMAIRRGRLRRRVALYGADTQGIAVIEHLAASEDAHYALVGYYDDRYQRVPTEIQGYHRRGGLAELEDAVERGYVDEVIVALPLAAVERLAHIMDRLSRFSVTVLFAPDLPMWRFFDSPVEIIGGAPMLRALDKPIRGWEGVAKFFEDRILGGLLVLLCSPVLALAALAIRLDSPGPVFFHQPRRGWNGGIFTITKFRTMRTDMEDVAGDKQTTKNDPRVTRVGRFLRRTSIDELPQLLNVLRGDMSLVGPRPHALGTKAEGKPFDEAVADYMLRYRVKPGITGWAQVNGWRGETDTNRKLLVRVRYDIEYIENWTIWFDLYILMVTPLSLLFRSRNAY
ncbi:undecaprenyl-phosphate glucose phosphotransferase [Acuticoccus sp. MNP-M23]|uniref:undecaprenyl-phosphate glucose phosphotransferase n=1 Tax=Acuticoccus sp. MNP-M23 TaxID=3072793 RepID=UPI002814E778|nr:undecaprenyl-phosphate glucose phosphotransferase [Acuticoccus sp. MNP-M23]WMS43691.1 undecaprenyl-phosphate glucose phosphotransferase [Acuticoccus sp. MNP-M23]